MFKSNCQVTFFSRTVHADGSFTFTEGTLCRGFFMERHRTDAAGNHEEFSELLLPAEAVIVPGDEVEIKGLRRTVAQVLDCTDVSGTVRCRRCSFLRS
jgi:hypothetical protein